MQAVSICPERLTAALAAPDGAEQLFDMLSELSETDQDGSTAAGHFMGWLLAGGGGGAGGGLASGCGNPAAAASSSCARRVEQLPPAQQHRLVSALAAWLAAARPPGRPAPPPARQLLEALAARRGEGRCGVAAAAALVLAGTCASNGIPAGDQIAGAAAPGGAAGWDYLAAVPAPPWLQRQAVLLAEATWRWGGAAEEAGGVEGGWQPADGGAAGGADAGVPDAGASPKRPKVEGPDAVAAPASSDGGSPMEDMQQEQQQQQQRQQQGQPAPAQPPLTQLLAALSDQLSALEESLGDAAAVDWALLERPAAWALLDGGGGGGGGGGLALEAAEGARGTLAGLSVDAVQALCRRLVAAAEATQSVAGPVLRWAVAPKVAQLGGAAPQPLVECLQLAARRQPGLLLDAVVRPLLRSPELRPAQAQALARLAKQEQDFRAGLLQALLESPLPAAPGAATGPAWREPHLSVLQALLDARAECVLRQLPQLVAALAAACDPGAGSGGGGGGEASALSRSPKLAQAIMALAAGFGPGLAAEQVRRLAAAAAHTQSFLTKGLLAKLRALEGEGGGGGGEEERGGGGGTGGF